MKVSFTEVGKNTVDRAELLLAGIPGGIDKALKSAISRSAQHLRTNASRHIRQRYDISAANLRMDRSVSIRYSYVAGSGVSADVTFSGTKIPLYRYNGASPSAPTYGGNLVPVLINGNWRMVHPGIAASGHKIKGTSPQRFDHAFVARFSSGHTGIFERTGNETSSGRDEVREIMGSSIPQMVGSPEVLDALSESVRDKFDERLTHEVDVLLNGWR